MNEYFKREWGPRKSQENQLYADYIDELIVISSDDSNNQPPDGYTMLPGDLNEGSGGKYINLSCHKVSVDNLVSGNNQKCISDISTVIGKDTNVPSGYEKIETDLNQGSRGDFIYLIIKRAEYSNENAIRSITIISGDNPDINPPYGFKKVKQDLNQGSGGNYVYLCFSKS